ncbi:hypothetical protein FQN57_001807 [Myotisia sp. PD_48]|nr:hypothetical protein FQN57_001807 [Myotisia sp. PD_48]
MVDQVSQAEKYHAAEHSPAPGAIPPRPGSGSTLAGNDPISDQPVSSPITANACSSYRFRRVASKKVVSFHSQDPANPVNWPKSKKYFVLLSGIMNVMNSTLGSSLPSGAARYIGEDFNLKTQTELVLPVSIFLVGYVFGPILCGPLSESIGRKPVMVAGFFGFILFTLACALSQNFATLLVMRFFVGVTAAAPVSIVGGLYADIYNEPRMRGRVMAVFMATTCVGPIVGPPISGFISEVNWRWTFWVGLILAGATIPLVVFMPETYAPVLLQRRARKLRKETGDSSIVSLLDLEKRGMKEMLTVTLTRPIRMVLYESIVLFTCLYISFVYGIFFLYFQTYPVIFQDMYHMSSGVVGLMFLPIGIGVFIALAIFFWWDSYLHKAKLRGAEWSSIEEYRRLPLATIGGPLYVISLLWLGWTASPSIHWVVPMLSGIPFGLGFVLIFMAMLNYVSDAYETFSASAQSAASCFRSMVGAALPIAAPKMYASLGVNWGCTLLAGVSLLLTATPFAFIKFGDRIRANSKFCQHLKQLKEDMIREEEEENRANAPTQADDPEKGPALPVN